MTTNGPDQEPGSGGAGSGGSRGGTEALPVALVHWNAPDWVASAVASILGSDVPVALTVVDNGPAAASARLQLPPEVTVLRPDPARYPDGNAGYAGGADLAIARWLADGDAPYLVVGSHDLHVEPDTLAALVGAADAHPECGILGPVVVPGGDSKVLDRDGDLELTDWLSGTCLLLRRECIEAIGAFDEEFGSYEEDRELGLRANDRGWRVGRLTTAHASGLGSVVGDGAGAIVLANRALLLRKRQGRGAALGHVAGQLARGGYHGVLAVVPNGRRLEHRRWARLHGPAGWNGLRSLVHHELGRTGR